MVVLIWAHNHPAPRRGRGHYSRFHAANFHLQPIAVMFPVLTWKLEVTDVHITWLRTADASYMLNDLTKTWSPKNSYISKHCFVSKKLEAVSAQTNWDEWEVQAVHAMTCSGTGTKRKSWGSFFIPLNVNSISSFLQGFLFLTVI